jgi:hypothetical protein
MTVNTPRANRIEQQSAAKDLDILIGEFAAFLPVEKQTCPFTAPLVDGKIAHRLDFLSSFFLSTA